GGVWTAGTSSSTSSSTTTTQGFSAGTFGEFALGSEKAATKLAFSVQPSDVLVNSPITPAVAVDVRTANDFRATMSSASVTMAIGTNPGGATLGGTTARSATNGQATFNDLTLNVAASGYTLAASSAGLTGATSTSFDVASSPGSCTSLSSGAWDVAARWNCGRVPKTTDDVTIAAGHAVTIPSGVSALAYSVTIAAAGTSQSLDLAAASTSLNVVGNVTISQPTNGNNSQLIVDAGTLTVGGSLTLNGSTTSSNRCMRLRITTGTLSVSGGLVVNNPGTSNTCGSNGGFGAVSAMSQIDMSGGGGSLNVAGQVTISHPANASLALSMHVSSVFNYNGSAAAQTVVLPSATNWTYSNLRTNNTHAGGATLEAAVTATKVTGNLRVLSGTLANGGFAISLANGSTFEVANGARFLMTATSGLPTAASGSITKIFGATSTVEYGGANQAIEVETYGHLALSGSGTKTAAGNISLAGDFTNNGVTFAGSTHTVTLSGSAATQTIGGTADSTFNNLTINKSAGGVSLGRSTTVNGTLALTSGVVTTSTNTLIIGSSGSVNRALCAAPTTSCFVQGNLRKSVATGSSVSRTLEVGTSSTYSPVTVVFDSVSVDGTLTASATGGAHPNLADSDIDTAKYVARYWTLAAAGGLAFTTAGATFSFAAADIQGGGDPNVFIVGRRSGGSWTKPTLGTRSATTTQATGLTGFGDFAVGIQKVYPPTANADAYSVYQGHTLTVAGPGVLGNDTDPQSLSLTVAAPRPASGPSNGSVTLNADGSLSYTPNSGFSGTDSFSYRATNGQVESTAATVTITVLPLAYVSSSSWLSSFDSGRYLALTFPAYLPAAATVEGATFRHTYRSYGGGTTCYYLEVYEGAALIGSHGSAGSPYSCNSGSSFQADVISLPEVNSADRANAAVVRLYVRNSAGGRSEHSLARLDLDYWLGSP
ncbi:MAG TPA: cadherin-like domain-containing protein, partial [Candidatus Limnocylindrales bacterium]|nr:cadherin-like domain-containing protein [Candidatus Limnocylindrales bacterium]